jgi:hypothetical protein
MCVSCYSTGILLVISGAVSGFLLFIKARLGR